jgi:hypothetical protein
MKKSEIEKLLREFIKSHLSEISTSAGAGAYQTPYAFSKDERDNLATQFMQKMGFKKVSRPKRPSNTKLVDYR